MIFFSHSSRIRILQLTFALVCSCSEGLLTTEKHHLVLFCLLIFCILCLSIQIKYFVFLDTQCTELKSVFHLLRLFYRQDRSSLPVCDYLDGVQLELSASNLEEGWGRGWGFSSRVRDQQLFCVSRVTKQVFRFSRFSKTEVVQNVKNVSQSLVVKQSASIIFQQANQPVLRTL